MIGESYRMGSLWLLNIEYLTHSSKFLKWMDRTIFDFQAYKATITLSVIMKTRLRLGRHSWRGGLCGKRSWDGCWTSRLTLKVAEIMSSYPLELESTPSLTRLHRWCCLWRFSSTEDEYRWIFDESSQASHMRISRSWKSSRWLSQREHERIQLEGEPWQTPSNN